MSTLLGTLSVVLVFFASSPVWAQTVHGVFRVVKGDVRVLQSSNQQEIKAKLGQKVLPKDIVIAGKDSRAKIVMVDKNEINISPETRVEIQNYEFKPSEGKKNVLLNIMYGNVRAKVNQKYEGDNKFQVKTPTAVAGVRGTDFFTSYQRDTRQTKVVTFEGRVAFGQPGPGGQILNAVFVSKGQTTSILANRPPPAPTEVPKTELTQMDQQTDTAKTESAPQKVEDSKPNKDKGAHSSDKNADTSGGAAPGAGGVSADASAGAGDGKPTNGSDAAQPEQKEARGTNQGQGRAPSSVGPAGEAPRPPTGSMLISSDLPSSGVAPRPPVMPVVPTAPLAPRITQPIRNDFLQDNLNAGPKKVNIKVTTGP